jgi:hypothetical protein
MSGAEALLVVGIIANILQLVDFSVNIYERAKAFGHDTDKLPKAFRDVSVVLPLIKSSLEHTKRRMDEEPLDDRSCQDLMGILTSCEEKIAELKEIFVKVLPARSASKLRYGIQAFKSVRHDKNVENLHSSLTNIIQALTYYHSSRSLSAAQFDRTFASLATKPEEPRKPAFMVRYEKEDNFIGRTNIMQEISKRFETKISRVVLAGIGGVGY